MVQDLERLKSTGDNDEKKLLKINILKEEINKHDDNELLNYYLDNGELYQNIIQINKIIQLVIIILKM